MSKFIYVVILIVGVVVSPSTLARTFQQVDGNGNPIGSPKEIDIPDNPNSSATLQGVDSNGNPVGESFQIPDNVSPPHNEPSPSDDGMVPETNTGNEGGGDSGGE